LGDWGGVSAKKKANANKKGKKELPLGRDIQRQQMSLMRMRLRCKLPTIPREPKQWTPWLMSASESTSTELICVYPGCKSSGRVFNRSYELDRHKLIHFPNQKLACPIQDCKHKKKGKTFTRNDKFREHIAAHGELALFRCPVSNCKLVQVKNGDFASHVANDHNILERYEIESFLTRLRISCDKGRWACPFLCDFSATSKQNVHVHLETHDLSERVELKSSLDLLGLGYYVYIGRASCPICNIQICKERDHISNLCRHLKTSHDLNEMIPNGVEIAKLLGHFWDYGNQYPTLMQVVRDFKPAQVDPSTLPPPISGSSSGEGSSRSSAPPTNLENVLSASNVGGKADTKNSSDCIGELPAQQVCIPHWTNPRQSIVFPATDVTGHNLPPGELAMTSQSRIAQQNLAAPPQPFLQAQVLIPQQNFSEQLSIIQPQGFMIPQTFMSASVSQNIPVVSTFIPPFMFQGVNLWQPMQSDASSLGYNQYHPYGPNPGSLLPNMNAYGVENHQQGPSSFVPFSNSQPDEMGFGHHSEFDWSLSEAAQWGERSSNSGEHPLHDSR
jgi:hypothetical protein